MSLGRGNGRNQIMSYCGLWFFKYIYINNLKDPESPDPRTARHDVCRERNGILDGGVF